MKHLLSILTITSAFLSFSQKTASDTIFILKEKDADSYHAIFIEKAKDSKFYDQLSDFNFGMFEQESYDYSIKCFAENNLPLTKKTITDLPLKWIVLKMYKGNFYTYKPSDFLFHYQAEITDSTFISYTGEGPIAKKIRNYKMIDKRTFSFDLTSIDNPDEKLLIHLIDPKNGIAVFEEPSETQSSYYLMVSADKIRNLPIIVNYCETQKQMEFTFDDPDYKALIKR